MKKIYILLSRTNTVPARIIRKLTPGEFSHTSISLYPRTDHFYSYARRHINNPMIAGFISEDIHTKVFAKYPDTHCAVYCINVSDEGYDRAKKLIKYIRAHKKEATYNFIGVAPLKVGIPIKRKYKFTCSQFAAFLLQYTGDVKLPKDPYLMLPNDFPSIENATLIYDGLLKDCVISPYSKM